MYDRRVRLLAATMLLLIGGCYPVTATPPPPDRPRYRGKPILYDKGTIRAFHRCIDTVPPVVSIVMQSTDLATGVPLGTIQLELQHGPADAVPRIFAMGGTSPHTCGAGCFGTVWLDALEPGKRARGRYQITWVKGRPIDEPFDIPWDGGQWDVQPCPGR